MATDLKKIKGTIDLLKKLEAELWICISDFNVLLKKHTEFKTHLSQLNILMLNIDVQQKSIGSSDSLQRKLLQLEAKLTEQALLLTSLDKEMKDPERVKSILKGDISFQVDNQVYKNIPEWLSETQKRILILEQDIDKLILLSLKQKQSKNEILMKINGYEIILEKACSTVRMSFEKSLELIQSKGYSRHLLPFEFFTLDDSQRKDFQLGMEWLNMMTRVKDDKLYIAFNPKHVTRVSGGYAGGYRIEGADTMVMPLGKLKLGRFTLYADFPEELKQFVGPKCRGLYLRKGVNSEEWRPIGCGYGGMSYGPFDLNDDHDGRQSRGVR